MAGDVGQFQGKLSLQILDSGQRTGGQGPWPPVWRLWTVPGLTVPLSGVFCLGRGQGPSGPHLYWGHGCILPEGPLGEGQEVEEEKKRRGIAAWSAASRVQCTQC